MTSLFRCVVASILASIVASLGSGCGLISSDVTNFDLTLPDKQFTIDTASWDVTDEEAQLYLDTNCASNAEVCSSAVQAACPMNCSGVCNVSTQTCDLSLDVGAYQPIDLLGERPELQSIDDEPVIDVTIDSVTWEAVSNTLTIDTPTITVYVAPTSVMDPQDPQAKPIGTIPPLAAGTATSEPEPMVFAANGRAELIGMMRTFKTPFNVIVGTAVIIQQGQSIPTGKLEAIVHIRAHAGL